MCLLLPTGIGPLIAWRQSSVESLWRAFLWPTIAGVAVASTLIALGVRHFYALVSLALCTFVAVTVSIEFVKGSLAIRSKSARILRPPPLSRFIATHGAMAGEVDPIVWTKISSP
jgi:hypothetical protein